MANEQLTRFLLKTMEIMLCGWLTTELMDKDDTLRRLRARIHPESKEIRDENVVDLAVWRERRGK